MANTRRRLGTSLAAVLLLAAALAITVGSMLASPARAQTYPITPSSGSQPAVSITTTPPTTAAAKGALAFTGADIAATMAGAAVVIGAGGFLVLASRKRKAEQQ